VLLQFITNCKGYYWRPYHGQVPVGAFVGGKDILNQNIYIGNAFVPACCHSGIFPASIQEGNDIIVEIHGVKKADSQIQILCADEDDTFEWLPANATHLHFLELHRKNKIVWGGVEEGRLLGIGRIMYQGHLLIGKILAGNIAKADLYFVYKGQLKIVSEYEILTYIDKRQDDVQPIE